MNALTYNVRGMLSFAVLGLVGGLVAVEGVSLVTYVLGAACVGAVWMLMPLTTQLVSLAPQRSYLVLPVALLWPLTTPIVLVFLVMALSDRPRAMLGGAVLASATITALVFLDPPSAPSTGSRGAQATPNLK